MCVGGVEGRPASTCSTLEVGSVITVLGGIPEEVLLSKKEITLRLFKLTSIKS